MITLILGLFISTFTLIILFKIKKISKRYGFYDNPAKGQNKIHKHPISNIGGLSCLIPFLIAVIISYFIEDIFSKKFLIITFITALCFYSLGRLDDIKNLTPNRKFCTLNILVYLLILEIIVFFLLFFVFFCFITLQIL